MKRGWASLSGELNYEYQRQLATAPVRYLNGASSEIIVKPSLSSFRIKSDIQTALKLRALIDAEEVMMTVTGSKVKLSDVVQSWPERYMVSDSVCSTSGVSHVTDNISVAY